MSKDMVMGAFQELVEDTEFLWDPDSETPNSAVEVDLGRDCWGGFSVAVKLRQIEGGQLSFVLSVARKFELEACEEQGWLYLRPHYTESDTEDDEEPALEQSA